MTLWNRLKAMFVSDRPKTGEASGAPDDGIAAFWHFWSANADAIAEAIEQGTLSEWNGRVNDAVAGIDPALDWEFGKGTHAAHYFCVSSAGNMARRVVTERWLQRAPRPTATWEFYPAKPAVSGNGTLEIGGSTLSFAEVRVRCERSGYRLVLDVEVFHPDWSKLSDGDRGTACFVFLDSTLGEDGVERWLGTVEPVVEEPADTIALSELKARTAQLAEETDTGVILRATTDAGKPLVASLDVSIKRIDHLGMDAHVQVSIPFSTSREDGLCDEVEAEELSALEDDLLAALEPDALYVGRRTFESQRVLHLRASSQGAVAARAEQWARRQSRDVEVSCELDPEWKTMPW